MKLHIDKVAASLNIPVNTLKRWIRQGRIPVHRSEDVCIFKKEKIQEWAKRHKLSFEPEKEDNETRLKALKKNIVSLSMKRGGIFTGVSAVTKEEFFERAIKETDLDEPLKKELLKRLLDRENLASTGIGQGIAIPHPREPLSDIENTPKIITVFPDNPVEYKAVDNLPVFVAFFIICSTIEEHLAVLSNLSFCLRDKSFVGFLKKKPDLMSLISETERYEELIENM